MQQPLCSFQKDALHRQMPQAFEIGFDKVGENALKAWLESWLFDSSKTDLHVLTFEILGDNVAQNGQIETSSSCVGISKWTVIIYMVK